MRFCRMAPIVMHASAASAKAMPSGEKRARPMPCQTTSTSPHKATASPASRRAETRRSTSSKVRMGCTPSTVASTPGVMPRASASR